MRRALCQLTVLPMILAAMTACGGSPDGPEAAGDPDTGGSGPGGEVSRAVGATFWHSGFQVEVGQATLSAPEEQLSGQVTRTLTVAATFHNEGPDEREFDAQTAVVGADGNAQTLYPSASDLPRVPSGLSTAGMFGFLLPEDFDLDSAYLLVGWDGDNQARIPLGPGGGELVDLAPFEVDLTGEIALELIDLAFTGAEVRADVPESYTEVAEGQWSVWLYFDVTSRRSGNWNVRTEHFALSLPDGSAVAAVGSRLVGLPGDEEGQVTTDLFVRFLVPDPPQGTYTLRFQAPDWFVVEGSDAPTEGTLDLTL